MEGPPGRRSTPVIGLVSLVVPTYNERDNIAPLLDHVHAAMSGRPMAAGTS